MDGRFAPLSWRRNKKALCDCKVLFCVGEINEMQKMFHVKQKNVCSIIKNFCRPRAVDGRVSYCHFVHLSYKTINLYPPLPSLIEGSFIHFARNRRRCQNLFFTNAQHTPHNRRRHARRRPIPHLNDLHDRDHSNCRKQYHHNHL